MGMGPPSLVAKCPGHEADHLFLSNARVKDENIVHLLPHKPPWYAQQQLSHYVVTNIETWYACIHSKVGTFQSSISIQITQHSMIISQ
jgi:hypothetical protein